MASLSENMRAKSAILGERSCTQGVGEMGSYNLIGWSDKDENGGEHRHILPVNGKVDCSGIHVLVTPIYGKWCWKGYNNERS